MFLFRKYTYAKIISVIWITQISLFDSRQRHGFLLLLHKDPQQPSDAYHGIYPWVTRPKREAYHSPPTSANIIMCGTTSPLPHTPSWCTRARNIQPNTYVHMYIFGAPQTVNNFHLPFQKSKLAYTNMRCYFRNCCSRRKPPRYCAVCELFATPPRPNLNCYFGRGPNNEYRQKNVNSYLSTP